MVPYRRTCSDADVWHNGYDCLAEEEILFQLIPHVLPADMSMKKETDEGYCHALFKVRQWLRPN